jgi:hypothetical protein
MHDYYPFARTLAFRPPILSGRCVASVAPELRPGRVSVGRLLLVANGSLVTSLYLLAPRPEVYRSSTR